MTWFGTIVTAILTGALGCVVGGYVANLSVRWYRISSFEGGAGYYVVALALGGLLAGIVIGVIVSRAVAASASPGFFKGLGISLLTMLLLVGVTGGVARLKADVPPTIDGEELELIVEARWPSTQAESPANVPGVSYLELASVSGSHVQRMAKRGALWKEDAKLVDGRWTVTGAVALYTSRGTPSLDIALNDSSRTGFILNLPGSPSASNFEWTEWYPKDGKNGPTKVNELNYRYRVQKRTLPVRTETIGEFEVSAIANGFMSEIPPGTNTLDPNAYFEIKLRGKAISMTADSSASAAGNDTVSISMLALLPGAKPALLALLVPADAHSYCVLLTDQGGELHTQRIAECSNVIQTEELTSDSVRFLEMKDPKVPHGRVDRKTYANSELLLFHRVVLNVANRSLHPFTAASKTTLIPSVPPLGVAPDKQSFVRFTLGDGSDSNPMLAITDFVRDKVYELPVDPARMRFANLRELDADWLMHHFMWQRRDSGVDTLVARTNFVPIPYHGTLTIESDNRPYYKIEHGGQAIRMALIELLEKEFKAKREPVADDAYDYPVLVDGKKVSVASTGGNDYVMVSPAYGEPQSDVVQRIAKAFNAILATGKYDAAFVK